MRRANTILVVACVLAVLGALAAIAAAVLMPQSEEARIKQAIADAGYCSVASDCEVLYAQCPFGCYAPVNRTEADRIQNMLAGYQSTCAYMCVASQGVSCVSNRCVMRTGTDADPVAAETYYSDDSMGLAFTYRSDAEGYMLRRAATDDEETLRIVLLRNADIANAPEGPSDGPPSISVTAFPLSGATSAQAWLTAHPQYSQPATEAPEPASIGGVEGLRWGGDGLYASDNAIVIANGHAYVFTVQWIESDSPMRADFTALLDSVRFLRLAP